MPTQVRYIANQFSSMKKFYLSMDTAQLSTMYQ